jgi:hypothetical protein
MAQNEFQDIIDGDLSANAMLGKYAQICGQIAREIDEQDERALHQVVQVDGFVKHVGGGSTSFTGEGVAYQRQAREMNSGDEIRIRQVLAQMHSLDDVVVFTFNTNNHVIGFINNELAKHSPVLTGRYMRSHVVFGDGVLYPDIGELSSATNRDFGNVKEWTFVNTQPYSRKIESGQSAMAPNGVFEIVAKLAQDQFPFWRIEYIDYVGSFDDQVNSTTKSYGHRSKRRFNKSGNRYPAIRAFVPSLGGGEERVLH